MKNKTIILFLLILFFGDVASAQKSQTTLGIQLRPMVPSKFFGTGPAYQNSDSISATLYNHLGWNAGVVLRQGLNKMWSIETGISMVQRNYKMDFESQRFHIQQSLSYQMIGYEIPLQALIYVQLGEQWYMNGSGGVSFDFYPSNLQKFGSGVSDTAFIDMSIKTYRQNWMMPSILANLGFEYRTPHKGYYYVGASYHRPLSQIAVSDLRIESRGSGNDQLFALNGTYLTLDLRYFLPESTSTKKKKT
ncbi:MAG: hypothetical protein RL062_1430 [Bacteroidota bacterium]